MIGSGRRYSLRQWACTTSTSELLATLLILPGMAAALRLFFDAVPLWGPLIGVGVGGVVGTAIRARSGVPSYWDLTAHDRRLVRQAQYDGVATRDATLDRIALDRQRRASRGDNLAVALLDAALTVALVVAAPVLVARGASAWWLLVEVPVLAAGALLALAMGPPSPRARLRCLQTDLERPVL